MYIDDACIHAGGIGTEWSLIVHEISIHVLVRVHPINQLLPHYPTTTITTALQEKKKKRKKKVRITKRKGCSSKVSKASEVKKKRFLRSAQLHCKLSIEELK